MLFKLAMVRSIQVKYNRQPLGYVYNHAYSNAYIVSYMAKVKQSTTGCSEFIYTHATTGYTLIKHTPSKLLYKTSIKNLIFAAIVLK